MLDHDQVVVVDGASFDATVQKANLILGGSANFKLISEPDNGIYDAWNKALEVAEGEWIAFLGCGDLLENTYRSEMLADITTTSNTNFIHCKAQLFEIDNGNYINLFEYGVEFDKKEFKKRMRVCHVGALHHRSLFRNLKFSTRYHCVSDYLFLLQSIDQLLPKFMDKTLVKMEANGISSNPFFVQAEEREMKIAIGNDNISLLWFRYVSSILKSSLFWMYLRFKQKLSVR